MAVSWQPIGSIDSTPIPSTYVIRRHLPDKLPTWRKARLAASPAAASAGVAKIASATGLAGTMVVPASGRR